MGQSLREGGVDLRRRALNAVKERISCFGDRSEIQEVEWEGRRFDVLTAIMTRFGEHLDTCMGEFFFRPVAGDPEGGQYFCAVLSLRGDIPLKRIPELAFAVSITNFYLETGCFALNKPTDLLAYRNTRTFRGDTSEESILRECVLLMEEAYEIAAKYCTPLLALAEGSMTLTDYMDHVKT